MIRARDWERSWTAWHTPTDQREALRAAVLARAGARYELIAPPLDPCRGGVAASRGASRTQGDEDATA
jgi:hypothetical protein